MPTGPRPAPPVGSARVAITGTIFGHRCINVFYLNLTGASIVTSDLNTLASAIATEWNTQIVGNQTADYTLTQVEVRYIPSAGNELIGVATVSHAGGLAVTTIQDASACIVIDWKITARYRGGHPRSYIAGVAASSVTSGSALTGGQPTNLATAAGTVLTYLNGYTAGNITGSTMGTVHFQSANAWLSPPVFRPYTAAALGKQQKLGSQRRRILS